MNYLLSLQMPCSRNYRHHKKRTQKKYKTPKFTKHLSKTQLGSVADVDFPRRNLRRKYKISVASAS
jgi:hypothetical protein